MSCKQFEDKVVWLTGGSRGIGAAIAKKLADDGASLILTAREMNSFREIQPHFRDIPNIFYLPGDVTDENAIIKIYDKIEHTIGKVDVLINNAGIGIFKNFTDITIEDFDRTIAVNLRGSFLCSKAVLPDMIDRSSGTIINILSGAAIKAYPYSSVYAASKAAVLAMGNTLREEVRKFGVKVVNILPGATVTDIWDAESLANFSQVMMKPEDIADAVSAIVKLSDNKRMMLENILLKPQNGDI